MIESPLIPACIFAKPPVPGKVKTRLIPELGAENAARLARAMLADVWSAAASCSAVRPILAAAEPGEFPLTAAEDDIWQQGHGDLGERLERILRRGLEIAPAAMALGADSPLLSASHIEEALRVLENNDAAIGPCADGGFYLLALKCCPLGLLQNLPWSSPETFAATKERLQQNGFSVQIITPLFDVDTPEDLALLRSVGQKIGSCGLSTLQLMRQTAKNDRLLRVSIIVPTLNEESELAATIRALENLSGDKEILIADGGSTDSTVAIAEQFQARVVHAPRGRGSQMHAAACQATGNVLWFVHADTKPPPGAIGEIERALRANDVMGGNFGLVFDGGSRAARQLTFVYPMLRLLGLCYGDSGIFIRRDIYEQIGGFRSLALFEDVDLLRRMRRAGRFVHLPSRIVTSSRRFEQRNFTLMWLHWISLQVLYWCGVSPNWLASRYRAVRK